MGPPVLDVPEQVLGDLIQTPSKRGPTTRRDLSEELIHLGFGLTNEAPSIWG